MAQSVLSRALDRGLAGARRLRGRATAASAGDAEPLPAISGGELDCPLPADARQSDIDRSAGAEELNALRRALAQELDRLALREGSTTVGPQR